MRPDSTEIISPPGASGGNLLSPGQGFGQLMPHGFVWPHYLPRPEDFNLSSIASPSATKALVPSIIHTSPPASGGPSGVLASFQQGIATPLVTPGGIADRPAKRALGYGRKVSRNAVQRVGGSFGFLSNWVRRQGGTGLNKGRGIRPLGIRWS